MPKEKQLTKYPVTREIKPCSHFEHAFTPVINLIIALYFLYKKQYKKTQRKPLSRTTQI